ncbi:MAG: VIT1/CCC1 transporter family protein [Myxococcaceae bacterium]
MSAADGWSKEKESAYLYRVLAKAEPSPERQKLFEQLATEAESQAKLWEAQAAKDGQALPSWSPSLRSGVVAWLVRRLRPERSKQFLAAMKVRGMSVYSKSPVGHEVPKSMEDIGHRHDTVGGGNLRAIVFGANDGLVSNASLILGIAGANASSNIILLSGAAGLLAGAFSMAAGEYISVRTQRELFENQISAEREELAQYPDAEAAELALIYRARGLSNEDAERISKAMVKDPSRALDTLAREELGLDPNELGSPWGAAVSSFFSFAIGAIIPLVPFILSTGSHALFAAIGLTGAALFGMGATVSLFTGKSALHSGGRMLLIGGLAGAATFGIGRLLGVSLS